ncbi:MAG TPA: DUF45 domain-containing protein [Desulfobacteraceae bacterium]|nr:DUF45 domain-containing protein [Desulfobacteraceae bacterium]
MKSRNISIEGIGEILMERSSRAKRISLSIRPFKGVRVAVPFGVSFERAEDVARSRASWIRKHLPVINRLEKEADGLRHITPLNRSHARDLLVRRLNDLCERHGFTYNRVFIRNQKARWGSCSGKDNINLNVNLARLPDNLIDYLILHELVHTRVRNHGPQFWELLNQHVGEARKLDREMNKYRGLLIRQASGIKA